MTQEGSGQQRAAGNVLIGMGFTSACVALCSYALGLHFRFIDSPTMGAFAIAMALIGWWQRGQTD